MPFSVTLETTGESFVVEEGETILQAAQRQRIAIPYGCDSGICGVCISRIVAGGIVYPDGQPMALLDEDLQAGKGLCCVGHPGSDLVIEPLSAEDDWEPWD